MNKEAFFILICAIVSGFRFVCSGQVTQVRVIEDPSNIYFEYNESSLGSASRVTLDSIVSYLAEHPRATLRLLGFTDSIGSRAYNMRLSVRRANSVVSYLDNNGISRSPFPQRDMAGTTHCHLTILMGKIIRRTGH